MKETLKTQKRGKNEKSQKVFTSVLVSRIIGVTWTTYRRLVSRNVSMRFRRRSLRSTCTALRQRTAHDPVVAIRLEAAGHRSRFHWVDIRPWTRWCVEPVYRSSDTAVLVRRFRRRSDCEACHLIWTAALSTRQQQYHNLPSVDEQRTTSFAACSRIVYYFQC